MVGYTVLEKLTLPKPTRLLIHEWLSVVLLLGLFVGTIVFIFFTQESSFPETKDSLTVINQEIEVQVEGAVEHPGTYRVKRGTLLKDVLSEAKPNPQANLSRIKLERVLKRKKQVIKVPAYKNKKEEGKREDATEQRGREKQRTK